MLSRKMILLLTIAPLVILIDQVTKSWVIKKFSLGESIEVIDSFFNLTYVRNPGAAFGFMASVPDDFRVPFFFIVPIVALVAISMMFRALPKESLWQATALSLIVGGAIGNFIDRLAYGYVIDFLDFHWKYQTHFPAFNVADSAITVGVILLIFETKSVEKKNVSRTH